MVENSDSTEKLNRVIEQQKVALRNLEKSLLESETTMRTLVSRLPLGLVVLNQEFKIEAVNNRVVEIFEYSTGELSGSDYKLLFPRVASITELQPNEEILTHTKSGKPRYLNLSINSARIKNEPKFFVHIIDTTEKHKLEQLKRDFVNMLSHDLRSPISSLQILLTMLEDGDFGVLERDGEQRVSAAKRNTERLIKMITELLDLEKMEEGLFKLEKTECSFSAIVDGAIDDVFELCDSKDLSIESSLGEFTAVCDPDQIRRVVVNILTNSIKFAPETTTISVQVQDLKDALVVLIKDKGPGIPEDKQDSIFNRFQQVEDKKNVGTGLGLAICKAIVEAHGGSIGVRSKIGEGSEFWFSVPATQTFRDLNTA